MFCFRRMCSIVIYAPAAAVRMYRFSFTLIKREVHIINVTYVVRVNFGWTPNNTFVIQP